MTPEQFEKLDEKAKSVEVDRFNEEERQWAVTCRKCGFKNIGTLRQLRGKPCGACGHG